jgi:hypothetical protein
MTRRGARPLLLVLLAALGCFASLGAGGAVAAKPSHERLSLRIEAVRGRQILALGAARPNPGRGRVVLQSREGGAWRKLGQAPVRSQGEYSIRVVLPAGAGTFHLRAALSLGKRQRAVSPVRRFQVPAGTSARPRPPAPPASTPPASPPTPISPIDNGGLIPEDPLAASSLLATIDGYSALPNHLSGTANATAALDEFSAKLAAAGLTVGEQAFTYPRFTPTAVGLTAGATTVSAAAIAPYLYSGATGPAGISKPLFYAGEGTAATFTKPQVEGKIVVVETPYEHNSKAIGLYPAIERAVEDGAAGFVAVTEAVGDYPKWEDTNARTGTGPLPVVMVGKVSGAAVVAAAKAGESGTLTLAADHAGLACERDVWGELEGADPSRRVFVGVPASSYTPSASEHGTGVAIALGLARHYAALPRSERPESLVFIALGGHEVGWLGLQALLGSARGPWLREADAYVHLGSALGAPRAEESPPGSGNVVTYPEPDPTGRLHDSENPLLEESVIEDFEAAGVPTPETPPFKASGGEQTNAYAAGIPTASFSGASLFFHTAGDTPGTVDGSILERQADAFRRVVDTITAIPAGELVAQNAFAAAQGAKIDAAKRAPVNPTLGAVEGSLGEGGVGGPPATPVAACP